MYVYVCVCMCMYVYVCVCMCMYVYVCVCMCVCIYIYIYIYTAERAASVTLPLPCPLGSEAGSTTPCEIEPVQGSFCSRRGCTLMAVAHLVASDKEKRQEAGKGGTSERGDDTLRVFWHFDRFHLFAKSFSSTQYNVAVGLSYPPPFPPPCQIVAVRRTWFRGSQMSRWIPSFPYARGDAL